MKTLSNIDMQELAMKLAKRIIRTVYKDHNYAINMITIYGVPRGGIPVAYLVRGYIDNCIITNDPEEADVIIDDIIDSGKTKERHKKYGKPFFGLIENSNEWIEFPWETKDQGTPIDDNILRIQQYLEDNKDEKVIEKLKKLIKGISL